VHIADDAAGSTATLDNKGAHVVDDPIGAYTADGPTGDTTILFFNDSGVDQRDTSAFSNNL